MDKKTPAKAYYYSLVPEVTQAQLKAIKELPETDFSAVEQRMDKHHIYGIVEGDSDYHRRVEQSPAPPHVFYGLGELNVLDMPIIAIVGPRQMSSYAEQVLENLFNQLCLYHVATISGMADGVDTRCHELSLQYNIPTIAILGGGFRHFLRGTKRELMKKIPEQGGLIISEYKHGFIPTTRSFPQRNRLIAGIADIVFLPEAKEESGSLITADAAKKNHRPVYAPMNSIFSVTSTGTNKYLAAGKIIPLDNLEDFLAKHFTRRKEKSSLAHISLTPLQTQIMSLFSESDLLTIDAIAEECALSSVVLLAEMTMLEMEGYIFELSPGIYSKK